MEKVIYSKKLKKVLAGILVSLVLLYIMIPMSYAAMISFNPKQFYPQQLPENADEIYDWNLEEWKLDEQEVLLYYSNSGAFTAGSTDERSFRIAIAQYNTKIQEAKEKEMSLSEAVEYAAGEATDTGNDELSKVDDVVEVDEEGSGADLGGILLSPVFYLVNFIADAITSNLGRIMIGDDASFANVTGTKVLQEDPIELDPDKNYCEVDANMSSNFLGTIQYPNIPYTPEEIFSGKIDLLSIDFISGKNYEGNQNENSGWMSIRGVISQWYQILVRVGIIGLLSVLLYTGIKIMISANANDKAKYKEWIGNWFIAVAILFAMHYMMAFIISVTGEFSKLLGQASEGIAIVDGEVKSATNLMGLVRFMIQSENFYTKIGYEVMYIALIIYTIKFTVIYLKRVLNMAFLTLIAPIVALTYPIDKINDGKAQGFDMWIKEYVFNALLQPMHLIMYYVLVGSATSIAASNPIYGIVVLMFMTEAEKLLKRIFGFDKASGGTVGGMAGAFAAGAIASSVKDIARMAKLPGGNSSKGSSNSSRNEAIDSPKPINKPGMDVFGTEGEPNVEVDNYSEEPDQKITEEDDDKKKSMPSQFDFEDKEKNQNQSNLQKDNNELEEKTENREQTDEIGEPLDFEQEQEQNNKSIREIAKKVKNSRQFKGAKAVGKRLIKPVWDSDKSAKYNFKRIAKNAGRTAIGFSIGATAAAVQAGISITDGKYSIGEGTLAFSAGYAGGGQISKGIGSLVDTYQEGTLPDDPKERKQEIMERAKARFADRDDVIAFNKKNYPGQEKEIMERQRDHYLTAGITDLKEMKSGIKFADSLVGKTDKLRPEQIKAKRLEADKKAAATIDFRKTLQEQGQLKAVYDKEKQEKYIQTMLEKADNANDRARLRRQYENAFKSVAAYDAANS